MEITWHGHTCFTLKEKKATVVINPDKQAGKLKGDVVLSSLKEEPSEVEGALKVFKWLGEYEIREVTITGFPAWTKSRSAEEKEGKAGDETIIFYFEMGEFKICHLGDLGHVLSSDTVKQLGDVDILMINLGAKSNLSIKKATEIMEAIEPRIVIPMGEGDFEPALKELGIDKVTPQDVFAIKSPAEVSEDKRLYVVLKKV